MANDGVKVIDKGLNNILKQMDVLKLGKAASVGVQGSEAGQDHDGATNVLIGSVHEFGSSTNPQRSHWRSTFDENEKKYLKELKAISKRVYDPRDSIRIEGDLLLLGETYKKDVIDKIKTKLKPPLTERTIEKKKGEDTPLIDSGEYINSFTAIVVGRNEIMDRG